MGESTVRVVRAIAVIIIVLTVAVAADTYNGISEAGSTWDEYAQLAANTPLMPVVSGSYIGDELKLIAKQNVALIALGAAILLTLAAGLTGRGQPHAEVPGSDLPPRSTADSGEADLSDRGGNPTAKRPPSGTHRVQPAPQADADTTDTVGRIRCAECGASLPADSRFCFNCGAHQT